METKLVLCQHIPNYHKQVMGDGQDFEQVARADGVRGLPQKWQALEQIDI